MILAYSLCPGDDEGTVNFRIHFQHRLLIKDASSDPDDGLHFTIPGAGHVFSECYPDIEFNGDIVGFDVWLLGADFTEFSEVYVCRVRSFQIPAIHRLLESWVPLARAYVLERGGTP